MTVSLKFKVSAIGRVPLFLQKSICLKHPDEDFILSREKRNPFRRSSRIFTANLMKKKDFYCYFLLAVENLLLAEQLQISASSSASKLPARANTSNLVPAMIKTQSS